MAQDFWASSGFRYLTRTAEGGLAATDEIPRIRSLATSIGALLLCPLSADTGPPCVWAKATPPAVVATSASALPKVESLPMRLI